MRGREADGGGWYKGSQGLIEYHDFCFLSNITDVAYRRFDSILVILQGKLAEYWGYNEWDEVLPYLLPDPRQLFLVVRARSLSKPRGNL